MHQSAQVGEKTRPEIYAYCSTFPMIVGAAPPQPNLNRDAILTYY
jgi:hypothetical protein